MNLASRNLRITILLLACFALSRAQIERWVYTHNGSGNGYDEANSIVFGADGNIYAVGYSIGSGSSMDFSVVSLTPSGEERWVYTYDGPGNSIDIATSVVYGLDGNIYAAGNSYDSSDNSDFFVVSLKPSGEERWVYRYNGPADSIDSANSIAFGLDRNIYAAGSSYGINTYNDFIVISIDTAGTERWVYRYDSGYFPGTDFANAIVCGSDTNIYAAGQIYSWITLEDFAIVSLDTSGTVRWIGTFDGNTITPPDIANSIAYGLDGELYAAGLSGSIYGNLSDLTVIKRKNEGNFEWVHTYNGTGNSYDNAFSIVYGDDNNIYVAGYSTDSENYHDFTVISLTNNGDPNWNYLYNGSGSSNDEARAIAFGLDDNLYVAGWGSEIGTGEDFLVIKFNNTGSQRWIYKYDGFDGGQDRAHSIVYGTDGNLYIAGYASTNTYRDFTVISLDTTASFVEEKQVTNYVIACMEILPNPFTKKTDITFGAGSRQYGVGSIEIYDIAGRVVRQWNYTSMQNLDHISWDGADNLGKKLPSGVYFLEFSAGDYIETKKVLLIR